MKISKLINYLTDVCGSCQGTTVYNKKLNSNQIDNKKEQTK